MLLDLLACGVEGDRTAVSLSNSLEYTTEDLPKLFPTLGIQRFRRVGITTAVMLSHDFLCAHERFPLLFASSERRSVR